jgi:hypothetical protein
MENKRLIVFLIFIMSIFLMSFTSALEFDNVLTYDETTKTAKIINAYNLPILGSDIGEVTLDTPLHVKVPIGYQKVGEFTIYSYKDYEDAIKSFEFVNMKNGEKIDRNIDLKIKEIIEIEVEHYEHVVIGYQINGTEIYNQSLLLPIFAKTHKENKTVWTSLENNKKDMKEFEELTIGIFTDVKEGDYVDWIPTIYGLKIEEWATWEDEGLTANLLTYISFNETSGNFIDYTGNYNTIASSVSYSQLGINPTTTNYSAGFNSTSASVYVDNFGVNSSNNKTSFLINFMMGSIPATQATLFHASDNNLPKPFQLNVGGWTSNKFSVCIGYGTSGGVGYNCLSTTETIVAGRWYEIIGSYNSTHLALYINGTLDSLQATTGTRLISYAPAGKGYFGRGVDASTYEANVTIDEFAIWKNVSLTSTQVSTIWNSGSIITPFTTFISPVFNITNPQNISYGSTDIQVNITNSTILNSTFYSINGGANTSWVINSSVTGVSGYNNITIWANSSAGNWTSDLQYFTIDRLAPTITLNYPTALINYAKLNQTLQLNFTATDLSLDKVWYNYNGTNITIAGALTGVYNLSNITLSTKKNVTIYANDTAGNLNTTTFNWDYKVFENIFTFNNETRAGNTENFVLNLTLHSSLDLISAILFYEGTPNYPSISSIGQFRVISLLNYAVPLYTVDTNTSLFFNIILDDATEINTTNVTQLVQAIFLDNCSTYTNRLFNISLFDEITKVSMRGDIEFVYKLLNVPAYQEINKLNMSFTNVSNISICSNINLSEQNFVQSIEIRYTSNGYKSEFYNIQRGEITDENLVINLFDLNSSSSTEFKVTYQDSSFDFVEDAIVQLQRKYVAEDIYEVVEAPLTSSDGVVLLHIDMDSVKYRATITKNGVLLDEFDNLVFKCQSELTGECEYKLLGNINTQNDLNYDNLTDFYYSEPVLTNESITITFSVPSGTPGLINLVMTQTDQFANKTLCNKTTTSSSGSLTCDYSESLGQSYIDLYLYKYGEGVVRTTYVLYPESELTWLGNNYIFIIILLFSLVGMALSSPEWIIINGIITIVISGGLWLANGLSFVMGLGNIIWLVIAGIILISKISQQEDR